jgi:hypothetical protein
MRTHILTGSKGEIAESPRRSEQPIREVIVFVDEPSDSLPELPEEDIFAEMTAFAVQVGGADCSRESLYTRMEGE